MIMTYWEDTVKDYLNGLYKQPKKMKQLNNETNHKQKTKEKKRGRKKQTKV